MIFVVGYHPVRKVLGPIGERECPNCSNNKHWLLQKTTEFISLFFIPLIPTRTKYQTLCPVCNFNEEPKAEELSKLKRLAELNQEALQNKMSSEEYESKLKDIKP
jgi:hypothetical protein